MRASSSLVEDATETSPVLFGGMGRRDLLSQQQPKSLRCPFPGHLGYRIPPARPLSPGADPVVVDQCLEVTADCGLGELQDFAELRDGQLLVLEKKQDPTANRVAENGYPLKNTRLIAGRGIY